LAGEPISFVRAVCGWQGHADLAEKLVEILREGVELRNRRLEKATARFDGAQAGGGGLENRRRPPGR
jgi:hypothetical protein